jgi:hypothetical protein
MNEARASLRSPARYRFRLRLSRKSGSVRGVVFELNDADGEQRFYRKLADSIRDAKDEIYRAGRGFADAGDDRRTQIHKIISAERDALENGVQIRRFQTSRTTGEYWADEYSKLMREHPGKLTVKGDFEDPPFVNVALIDPAAISQ